MKKIITKAYFKQSGYQTNVWADGEKEKYPNREREGLEGPFRTLSGKVVYYDNREGKYYDPNSDIYIEIDEYMSMQEPRKTVR